MNNSYEDLYGKKPSLGAKPSPPMPPAKPSAFYQKGDVIGGKYEVRGELGKGGFGVVYLAFDRESQRLCALKTFKDEYLADARTRAEFKKEVLLWVNLGQHPNIVSARWVSEVSGRLFVEMEYIAPDARKCVTLDDHLRKASGPLPIEQVLRWAAQFCAGMAYAYDHGITCHRDIKPGNILIAGDGTLKVSDFGLAITTETAPHGSKGRCGTPGYMAPEVYRGEGAGPASDLYSFGLVLWQMTKGDLFPSFHVRNRGYGDAYMAAVYQREITESVPPANEKLDTAIHALLDVDPKRRYRLTLAELQAEFEAMLGDRAVRASPQEDSGRQSEHWNSKGAALHALGKNEEALVCFIKAVGIDPKNLAAAGNAGMALQGLGRLEDAIGVYARTLQVVPGAAQMWSNMGTVFLEMGKFDDALSCFGSALDREPELATALNGKGMALTSLGRHEEAIRCFNTLLANDPRHEGAWANKADVLRELERLEEALDCLNQALTINPVNASTWKDKAHVLNLLARKEDALVCCDKAIEFAADDADAWLNKGIILRQIDRTPEAVHCFEKAVRIAPDHVRAWKGKGFVHYKLRQFEQAILCYDHALKINAADADTWSCRGVVLAAMGRNDEEGLDSFQRAVEIDPSFADGWWNKAQIEDRLSLSADAARSYKRFLSCAPRNRASDIAKAQRRLKEFE